MRACSVLEELNKLLSGGELLVLVPGQTFTQERTAVLIQGSLLPQVGIGSYTSCIRRCQPPVAVMETVPPWSLGHVDVPSDPTVI